MTGLELDPVRELTDEWLEADLRLREATEHRDKVGALLTAAMAVGDEVRMPSGQGVRLQAPSRRFDPETARAILPDDLYAAVCSHVPSARKATNVLPPALLDQCKRAAGSASLRRL